MTRVCVVGSVNLDTTLQVEKFPEPGETVLASASTATPGGTGGNQAVAAARSGVHVSFVGAVGEDMAGERLRNHLVANGVDVTALATVPGPSGAAVILVESGGENTIVVAPGANTELTLSAEAAQATISAADVMLVQLEIPVPVATEAARAAREAGVTVMVNASPAGGDPAELAKLAAVTDVVVVNETESAAWTFPTAHRVVTLGARGARYEAAGADGTVADVVEVPALQVSPVDTSGAGDTFAGVLAATWDRGPKEAMRRAGAAGALATLVPGAGDCAPSAAEIDEAVERLPG